MTPVKTTQRGLHNGRTRVTFILIKNHLEELKALPYWERKTIKEVLDGKPQSILSGALAFDYGSPKPATNLVIN